MENNAAYIMFLKLLGIGVGLSFGSLFYWCFVRFIVNEIELELRRTDAPLWVIDWVCGTIAIAAAVLYVGTFVVVLANTWAWLRSS